MRKFFTISTSVVLSMLSATTAVAAVVDFSDQQVGSTGSSFTIGAYRFDYFYGQGAVFFEGDDGFISFGDNQQLFGQGTGYTVARVDGAAFNLNSVVFAFEGIRTSGDDTRVAIDPINGGPITQILADGQTLSFGSSYQNITSVLIDAYSRNDRVGLRSLDLTSEFDAPEPASVPAPGALAMLGLGALALAGRRRRLG